jgi:hypothetical protein
MDPLHVQPDTEQLLAVILVAKNDLPTALRHLRNCLTYFPPGPNYELVKRQIAQIDRRLRPRKMITDARELSRTKNRLRR